MLVVEIELPLVHKEKTRHHVSYFFGGPDGFEPLVR